MSRGHSPMQRGRSRGFTLIEALTALLLVGIVLPVAMRGVTSALQASSTANHQSEATELCRSKLAELSVDPNSGDFTGGGVCADLPTYAWQSTYLTRDDGTDEITVTVTWQQASGPQSVSLATLVYLSTGAASGSAAP